MTQRVVVTGAQGLLGRHVVGCLLGRAGDTKVLGVGRSPRSDRRYTHHLQWAGRSIAAPLPPALQADTTNPRYDYACVDLRDPGAVGAVLRHFQPDLIIHSAAALRDERLTALVSSNIESVAGLLQGAADCPNPPRIVTVSSGSVYGAAPLDTLPLNEAAACQPVDLYAASKRAAEDVARIMAADRGLWLANARVFNLLGPGLQDRHLSASLAGQVAAIALGLSEPLIKVGPLRSTRDFVDVRDAAVAVVGVGEHGAPAATYNVASGVEVSMQRIFDLLVAEGNVGDRVRIQRQAGRPGDVDRSYADITAIRALGLAPRLTLERSLADMLRYYVESIASASDH